MGVTDGEWYRYLAGRADLTEVNFWRPGGGRRFGAIAEGELFFFKTHHPHNRVVGGGFFSGFASLPISAAWDYFGQASRVSSLAEMRARVSRYRRAPIGPHEDPEIGCVFVRDVAFFPADATADPPPDFATNIVQGKSYDLAVDIWGGYFHNLANRLHGLTMQVDLSQPWHRDGPVYGDPRLAPRRLGQQSFQAVVLNAYGRRCAITGNRIRPVLQAAHIKPLPEGWEHRLDNGLLLRSDVHTLYDRGYLGVDPRYRLMVSPLLREEFGNGDWFYQHAGQPIALPDRPVDRPQREFLEWHIEEVYQAS